MNILASGFANFINGIFANWQMLLFVVCAVLFVMTILFRKFKITFAILLAAALAVLGILLIDFVIKALSWNLLEFINFLVKWVPTVLFALTVIFATLFGAIWGLRKSLIFLLHAAVTGALCIILYVILVNVKAVDKFLLKTVDFFMGGEGSLCQTLGVNAECAGLKDVFVEWLPTIIPDNAIGTMLSDSKAYIYTLADMIYHVAFALVLYVLYVLLNIILYIIYHCCYSERKYKKKIEEKYLDNKVDRRYSRHTLGGSLVGLGRGIVTGLISLSFLGTGLFIVAGRGDATLKAYDFGDDQINEVYSYYRSVESYGTHGIFKVLNAVCSADKAPYYLFVADLIFSGELDDEEFGIDEHIVFREELDAYMGFARNALSLVMEYGGDKLNALLGGNSSASLDTVVEVLQDDHFRAKFNDLITEFDSKTYVKNLALSFVNSVIAHADDMSFTSSLSEDNKELLKILFTRGHYSDAIPDEKERKQKLLASGKSLDDDYDLPYINISRLVSKNDIQVVFNLVLDLLGENLTNVSDTLALVGDIVPEVQKISLLNEKRAEELDPVLGRLYTYAANRYLTSEGAEGVTYKSIYEENIEWIGEINSLVTVGQSALKLYGNIDKSLTAPMDIVLSIFDKDGANFKENTECFDGICASLERSKILGVTLSTSYVYNLIHNSLDGLFNGIYIPKNITYTNVYNEEGKLITSGEMYNVFNGVRLICEYTDLLSHIKTLSTGESTIADFLPAMQDALAVKLGNVSLATYIVKSNLLRSVVSAALITKGEEYVYVPSVARESDETGKKVNFITQQELLVILDFFDELVDFVTPLMKDEGNATEALADFADSSVFESILNESSVFEGTVGKLLAKYLGDNEYVVIPKALTKDFEGWVTVNGRTGELKRLLAAFKTLGMNVGSALELDGDSVIDEMLGMNQDDLDVMLRSQVLHYSVSKILTDSTLDFGAFSLVIPESAQQLVYEDEDSEGKSSWATLVRKSELKGLLTIVSDLDLGDDTKLSDVFVKVVEDKQVINGSSILSASIAYALANDTETADMLKLTEKFSKYSDLSEAKKYNSSNPWKKELPRLIDALDDILGISGNDSFTFNEDELKDQLSTLLQQLNYPSKVDSDLEVNKQRTRLRVCYSSEIIANNITERLDDALRDEVNASLIKQAKSNGLYKYSELEALSEALDIFDIDLLKLENNEEEESLKDKLKREILKLNDPVDEEDAEGDTKLDRIYPSIIIIGMMSHELDDALLDATDNDGNPIMDSELLKQIKNYKSQYSKEEISNLIRAISDLEIDDVDDLGELNFDTVSDNKDNAEEICQSLVMRGVFTKQIERSEIYRYDPRAYETNISVLKTIEIVSLVNLVDELGDTIDDITFSEVKLITVKTHAFDSNGNVTSHLIIISISDVLRDTKELIISSELIDRYDSIEAKEILATIDAFMAVEGEDVSVSSWQEKNKENTNEFSYPKDENRDKVFESAIIRTKITSQLVKTNNTGDLYISPKNIHWFLIDGTTNEYSFMINASELNALLDALDAVNHGNGSFSIPPFNLNTLKEYSDMATADGKNYLDLLYASDILRYRMCAQVAFLLGDMMEMNDVCNLNDINYANKDVTVKRASAKLEDIKSAINAYGSIPPIGE